MGDGRQWLPWIALEDIVGLYAEAVHGSPDWEGPVNACAPHPVTNAEFAKALGRALHRPAVLPIPPKALKVLYGDMAQIVTGGVRMVPARATELGYRFRHPDVDEALRSALGRCPSRVESGVRIGGSGKDAGEAGSSATCEPRTPPGGETAGPAGTCGCLY